MNNQPIVDGHTFEQMVNKLAKPGNQIHESLTDVDCELLHMSLGICTEAGELGTTIKSAVMYRKPLDIENVREEVGDLLFYTQGLLSIVGLSLNDCVSSNMHKLAIRYPKYEYSDHCAKERFDKKKGEV